MRELVTNRSQALHLLSVCMCLWPLNSQSEFCNFTASHVHVEVCNSFHEISDIFSLIFSHELNMKHFF